MVYLLWVGYTIRYPFRPTMKFPLSFWLFISLLSLSFWLTRYTLLHSPQAAAPVRPDQRLESWLSYQGHPITRIPINQFSLFSPVYYRITPGQVGLSQSGADRMLLLAAMNGRVWLADSSAQRLSTSTLLLLHQTFHSVEISPKAATVAARFSK